MSSFALRRLHRLSGVFFAPTLIFFALTGVVQVFDLHKTRQDRSPPALVLKAASLHKNQTTQIRSRPVPSGKPMPESKAPEATSPARLALKIFASIASACLVVTSILGVVLALTGPRDRVASATALGLGIVIPLLMILIL